MTIQPLGDQAAIAYCQDEDQAALLVANLRRLPPAWCIDVVQAYVSVALYYDVAAIDFIQVADWLATVSTEGGPSALAGRMHVIPCCYDLGLDLERVKSQTGLSREVIIEIHSASVYSVFAIGFCPGFPYLGYLPHELTGVSRLDSPRLTVEEGSVGLTGRQTGIYTQTRPGGWNIVGRTPLQLVDVKDEYFPIRTGDRVRFSRIGLEEFNRLRGTRLRPEA